MAEQRSSLAVLEDEHAVVQPEQLTVVPGVESARPAVALKPNVPRIREEAPVKRPHVVRAFVGHMLRFFLAIALAYLAADTWAALEVHELSALFALVPLSLATSLVVSAWLTALVFYDNSGAGVTAR